MYTAGISCCACLKNGIGLVNVWKTDGNNVKWSTKLLGCVPEVDWIDDYCICQACIEQLETVCSFRQLCIHSDSLRKLNDVKEEKDSSFNEFLEVKYSPDNTDDGDDSPFENDVETTSTPPVKYNLESNVTKLNCESIPKLDSYNCKLCSDKFNEHEELILHNKKAHKLEKAFECVVCDKSFRFKTQLTEHELIHLNQHSFKCELCPRAYNTSSLLRNHKICMHTDRSAWKYPCMHCKFRFPNKSNLDKHVQRKHTNSSDEWICYNCNKKCESKIALCRHIRSSHTAKIPGKECPECKKTFINQTVLDRHMTSKHGVGNAQSTPRSKCFECTKCGKKYTTQKVLKFHLKSCDGIKRHNKQKVVNKDTEEVKLSCEKCSATFKHSTLLLQHVKKVHDVDTMHENEENTAQIVVSAELQFNVAKADLEDQTHSSSVNIIKYSCDKCSATFKHTTLLLRHVKEAHDDISKQDNPGNTSQVVSNADLQINIPKVDHEDQMDSSSANMIRFSCEFCSEVLLSDKKFVEHLVNVHRKDPKVLKPFKCNKCSNRYVHFKNLHAHINQHEDLQRNICSFCGKNFKLKGELIVHERIHLNKRTYRCEECDKGFNTCENLRTHKIIKHRDPSTWNHVCSVCGKRFPIKSNYDQHMRRHMGDRRFICHLCPKAFVTRDEVTRHLLTHTNIKEHKCEHCNKEYKNKQTLDRHLKKAHNIGNARLTVRLLKHLCNVCPKRFYDATKLKRHLRTHTGQKPFACNLCSKRFIDKSYVKQHMKSVHDVVEESSFV